MTNAAPTTATKSFSRSASTPRAFMQRVAARLNDVRLSTNGMLAFQEVCTRLISQGHYQKPPSPRGKSPERYPYREGKPMVYPATDSATEHGLAELADDVVVPRKSMWLSPIEPVAFAQCTRYALRQAFMDRGSSREYLAIRDAIDAELKELHNYIR